MKLVRRGDIDDIHFAIAAELLDVAVAAEAKIPLKGLAWRDVPIGGLYALANCSAGIEYGVGYQAGLSLGKGMIFGYLAVKQLRALRDAEVVA